MDIDSKTENAEDKTCRKVAIISYTRALALTASSAPQLSSYPLLARSIESVFKRSHKTKILTAAQTTQQRAC
jgi:hypothetical protein